MGKRERSSKILEIKHEVLAQHLCEAATRYNNVAAFLRERGHRVPNIEQKLAVYAAQSIECINWATLLSPQVVEKWREKEERAAQFRRQYRR